MFESSHRLREDVEGLLEAVRVVSSARYVCVMEPGSILLETPKEPPDVSPQGTVEDERGGASPRRAEDVSPQGTVDNERGETPREIVALRRLLEAHGAKIFSLPAAMAGDDRGPEEDPFEDWNHDELCLAFVNGRVAVAIACPDAEAAREASTRPLQILFDRLLRLEPRYRLDRKGGGWLFSHPQLDFITIGRSQT